MESSQQMRVVRVLSEVSHPELPAATDVPGSPADVLCPRCRQFFTWRGVAVEDENCGFVCTGCLAVAARRTVWQRVWRVVTMPIFWITAVTLFGALFYVSGIGRPSLAWLARRDAGKEWRLQRVPVLYLKQVGRTRKVVELLAARGPSRQLTRWATQCREACVAAAEAWQGEPPEPHLRLAAATMLGYMGKPAEGLREAAPLAPAFPAGSASHAAYLYCRGRLALEAGQQAAGQADLEEVLRQTRGERNSLLNLAAFDELVESGGMPTGVSEATVRKLAGTDLPGGFLARQTIELLQHHGVNSMLANTVEREIKQRGGWNRSADDLVIEIEE